MCIAINGCMLSAPPSTSGSMPSRLGGAGRCEELPLWGEEGTCCSWQPVRWEWPDPGSTTRGAMIPCKNAEQSISFTLSFLLASCPHQHVGTQPQRDTEGQAGAGGTCACSIGNFMTQKPTPSRMTGIALQMSVEGPLACQSNTMWTTEQLSRMEKIAWHREGNVLFVTYVLLWCFLQAHSEVALVKSRNVRFAVDQVVCGNEFPKAIFL